MNHARALAIALAAQCLTACGRSTPEPSAAEPAAQAAAAVVDAAKDAAADKARSLAERRATELVLEQSANADGSKLKVTLGDDGSTRTEGLDKDGKPTLIHMNFQTLVAGELGVPVYPGAVIADKGGTRMLVDGVRSVIVPLRSADEPAKTGDFYRAELAKLPGVKQVMALPSGEKGSLQLIAFFPNPKQQVVVTVQAAQEGGGSELLVTRSEPNS